MPETWKYAKVSPIPKGGNCHLVSNYRPISLLPLLSKMMEKVVHTKLYEHLSEYSLLDTTQGGFRPGHSTVQTCAYFTEDL